LTPVSPNVIIVTRNRKPPKQTQAKTQRKLALLKLESKSYEEFAMFMKICLIGIPKKSKRAIREIILVDMSEMGLM
jgi:hypothetical protein